MKKLLLLIGFSVFYLIGCAGESQKSLRQAGAALNDTNGMDANGLDANGLDTNGLDSNGLDSNGLDANGLDSNGLDVNGLDANGLAVAQFNSWFTKYLSHEAGVFASGYSDMVIKYAVKCGAPSGQSLTLTFANVAYSSAWTPQTCTTDGVNTYCSWPGALGLAPTWWANQPIPVNEQQQISACMAAHINAKGEQGVNVSFRGSGLLVTADESAQYSAPEAVFWGNFFDGTGVFMQHSTSTFGVGGFSPRGCTTGNQPACDPMKVDQGGWSSSQGIGTRNADGSFTSNATAWYLNNAFHYQAIATFVDPVYAASHAPSGKGSIVVSVSGLPIMDGPNWAKGNVKLQGLVPDYPSVNHPVFHVMTAGTYSVTAYAVTIGGITYTPTAPASATVSTGDATVVNVVYQ